MLKNPRYSKTQNTFDFNDSLLPNPKTFIYWCSITDKFMTVFYKNWLVQRTVLDKIRIYWVRGFEIHMWLDHLKFILSLLTLSNCVWMRREWEVNTRVVHLESYQPTYACSVVVDKTHWLLYKGDKFLYFFVVVAFNVHVTEVWLSVHSIPGSTRVLCLRLALTVKQHGLKWFAMHIRY